MLVLYRVLALRLSSWDGQSVGSRVDDRCQAWQLRRHGTLSESSDGHRDVSRGVEQVIQTPWPLISALISAMSSPRILTTPVLFLQVMNTVKLT